MSDWSSSFDLLTRATGAASTTGTTPSKVDDTYYTNENYTGEPREKVKDNSTLTFEDMLLLMVTQLQNQTIDNQADTNDMMNQLIQMTVMQAMTHMSTQMEELTTANVMSYAASLVGKEVTLGVYDENGEIKEKVGVVEGTGTFDGNQVIFVDGESYFLSSIMGVGRLPPLDKDEGTGDGDKEDGDNVEDGDKVEGGEGTDKPQEPGESGGDNTGDVENSGAPGENTNPDPES